MVADIFFLNCAKNGSKLDPLFGYPIQFCAAANIDETNEFYTLHLQKLGKVFAQCSNLKEQPGDSSSLKQAKAEARDFLNCLGHYRR